MISCYCDDGPTPSIYDVRVYRAKKQHVCEECSRKIQKGELYERVFGVWEGRPEVFRSCEHCRDLRVWVSNSVPCFCPAHGGMDQQMREAVEEATWRAPDETKGLWFGFLRRVVVRDRVKRAQRAAQDGGLA